MRVHHPLQQGLRLLFSLFLRANFVSASASSITTRIKTLSKVPKWHRHRCASASSITTRIKTPYNRRILHPRFVRVHHPLQQGLRRRLSAPIRARCNSASASSITTRIKTPFRPTVRGSTPLCDGIIHYNKD